MSCDAAPRDARFATAEVLLMLGDNSTHSMKMAPLDFVKPLEKWLEDINEIRALDPESASNRWRRCCNASLFYLEFSPEFHKLLLTSRDERGVFAEDTVGVIKSTLGDATISSCMFLNSCHVCDLPLPDHATIVRNLHKDDDTPTYSAEEGSYNPFRRLAFYSFDIKGRQVHHMLLVADSELCL